MPLLLTLILSILACYLIGHFAPNLWVVLVAVIALQFGGFIWVVESGGVFRNYSIVNLAIISCLTFLWYLVAAQFHLWAKTGNSPDKPTIQSVKEQKGQPNG